MNLVEVLELLQHPEVKDDSVMVEFYTRSFYKLTVEINSELKKLGLPALSVRQLVLNSSNPSLVDVIPANEFYVMVTDSKTNESRHIRMSDGSKGVWDFHGAIKEAYVQNEKFSHPNNVYTIKARHQA